jgi:hypothetical protein
MWHPHLFAEREKITPNTKENTMNNMLQLFIGAWLRPWQTMGLVREQPQDSTIKPTVIYIALVGLLSGVIAAAMGYVFPDVRLAASGLPKWSVLSSIALLPLFYLIGSFISAGVVWGVVVGFVRGTANEYKTIYRLMAIPVAFYPVSTLLPGRSPCGESCRH